MTASDFALAGKTFLVTGGTAGIGLVTARNLAVRGGSVAIVGRDRQRGAEAVAVIRAAAPEAAVTFFAADLSRQEDVRALAADVVDLFGRLDVLVNNAGSMFGRREESADGIEMTFALNHLSYFLLSHELLPALKAAAPARIVNVGSRAHRGVDIDFANLQGEKGYSGWRAYKRSKLANLLFTKVLAERLAGEGITANVLHPGFVRTDIGVRHRFLPDWLWRAACRFAIDVEEGAETSTFLAADPDVGAVTGKYFVDCREVVPSAAARNAATAERLWEVSARMVGVDA